MTRIPADDPSTSTELTEASQADVDRILEAVPRSLNLGIYVARCDLSFVFCNDTFAQMFGFGDAREYAELCPNPRLSFDLFTPEGERVLGHGGPIARAVSGESRTAVEYKILRRDTGQMIHCSTAFMPILDRMGNILGGMLVARDIDAVYNRAQRDRQYRQELERLIAERTSELVEATKAAEAANRAKGVFLANISHEIRTPLHAITTIVSLMRDLDSTAAQHDVVNKLDAATSHLSELINSVLDLSQIEADRLVLDEKRFELCRLLEEAEAITLDRAESKGLALSFQNNCADAWLIGDPLRLKQALLNYIGNAIKFTDRGRIEVRASCSYSNELKRLLRFEVRDSGIGISPNMIDQLFEPFEQTGVNSDGRRGGSGLGLAISRRLARLMGGDAGVESEEGVGSMFWFTAWVRAAQPETNATSTLNCPEPVGVSEPLPTGREPPAALPQLKGKILLVDDDPLGRKLLELLLSRTGLIVECACDGMEAIDRALATPYDLILMDMQLPKIDGPGAAAAIVESSNGKNIRIIALTANAFERDRERCIEAGMCDFISKPINPTELFARVAYWLDQSRSALD